jgi:hypothetical protein
MVSSLVEDMTTAVSRWRSTFPSVSLSVLSFNFSKFGNHDKHFQSLFPIGINSLILQLRRKPAQPLGSH